MQPWLWRLPLSVCLSLGADDLRSRMNLGGHTDFRLLANMTSFPCTPRHSSCQWQGLQRPWNRSPIFGLFADKAGESHWRNVEVVLEERTFAPPARGIHVSEAQRVANMMFLRLPAGWNEPAHPTPKKQTLICLAGVVRVTPPIFWYSMANTRRGRRTRWGSGDRT